MPYCSTLQSGNWNDASVWSCGHEPTLSDLAIINATHTVTVSTSTAKALRINNGGKVNYSTGGKLTVKGGTIP